MSISLLMWFSLCKHCFVLSAFDFHCYSIIIQHLWALLSTVITETSFFFCLADTTASCMAVHVLLSGTVCEVKHAVWIYCKEVTLSLLEIDLFRSLLRLESFFTYFCVKALYSYMPRPMRTILLYTICFLVSLIQEIV